jgi:hypothetical protein
LVARPGQLAVQEEGNGKNNLIFRITGQSTDKMK